MLTCIIANDGTKLMPTTNIKKVRKLLKTKNANIVCHHPFTIQLNYKPTTEIKLQPIELSMDAGYQTIGISIKSKKHEFVSAEYELLSNEVEHHNDQRKYRRTRRNRLRYRAPRFKNRRASKKKGWLAPSIRNKLNQHLQLIERYQKYIPITDITVEVAQFDTQLVEAIERGIASFTGKDYQTGERYGYDTLREAVFARDNYTCQICKQSIFNNKKKQLVLSTHHIGYWKGDRTNRLNNLLTICHKCHTPTNHQPTGKLYGLTPKLHQYKGMAFMNSVKWKIYELLKEQYSTLNIHLTYGTITKRKRIDRNITKSHSNDAYCIGQFVPSHRVRTLYYKKKRRNNRVLSKFYDAVIIDIRSGEKSTGKKLSCNRVKRNIPRNNEENLRVFRGQKIRKGRFSIRRKRYSYRPSDTVTYNGNKYKVIGVQNNGDCIKLRLNDETTTVVSINKVKRLYHSDGWELK